MNPTTLAIMSLRILALFVWVSSLAIFGQLIVSTPGQYAVIYFLLTTGFAVLILLISRPLGIVIGQGSSNSSGRPGISPSGLLPLAFSLVGMILFIHGTVRIPFLLAMFRAESITIAPTPKELINSYLVYNLAPVIKIIIGGILIFRGKHIARYWLTRIRSAGEQ